MLKRGISSQFSARTPILTTPQRNKMVSFDLMNVSIKHKTWHYVFMVCFLALGCIAMFLLENYGGPGRDEQFQTLSVREYDISPLGLLVFWIGHKWSDLFGFSMLNLRILASIESLLAVGVTSVYFYRQLHKPMLSCIVFFLGCILLRTTGFNIYNWDSGTYLFDAISVCLLVSIIRHPSNSKCIWLGISIALMTLGRLPSGIFLPFSLLLIWISQTGTPNKFRLRSILLITGTWFLTVVLITWTILGSPIRYIELLTAGNMVTGHSLSEDSEWLINRFIDLIFTIPRNYAIALACIVFTVVCACIKRKMLNFIYAIIAFWSLLLLYIGFTFPHGIYSHKWPLGYDLPLSICLLLSVPVYNIFHKTKIKLTRETKLSLWACFALLCAMAFGSDAYWERCVSGFIIPVILCLLWPLKITGFHKFLHYFVLISTLTFSAAFIGHNYSLWKHLKDLQPISDSKVMEGLKGRSIASDEVTKSHDAILKLRNDHIPYIYLGNHLGANLEFGPDEGFSFQHYHYQFSYYDYWKKFNSTYIDNADAVIYLPDFEDYEYDQIVPELKMMGFRKEEKIGDAIILYREPRKNKE